MSDPTAAASRWPAANWALAALAGLLHTASFAPTDAWPLQTLAMAILAWLLQGAAPRRAAAISFVFGVAGFASGLWWLFISLHRYGGLPAALSVLAVLMLASALSLFGATFMAAFAGWRQRVSPGWLLQALGFAAFSLWAEGARASWFTGFPWLAGGYAHTSGPLQAWAPWVGVYGIGAISAGVGAAFALKVGAQRQATTRAKTVMALAAMVVLAMGLPQLLPHDFTRSTGMLTVSLLQPNIDQGDKFEDAQIEQELRWHQQELPKTTGQLVVTPESSVPLPLHMLDPDWLGLLSQPFKARGTDGQPARAALVGMFVGNDEVGYRNALVTFSSQSQPTAARDGGAYSPQRQADFYRYEKRHLLPFGEFVPTGFHWFVRLLHIPLGDQASGQHDQPFAVAGQRVRPLICFEDLFGEEIAASMVGDDAATVMANATNLAWFGTFMVQDQHLQFSRMRALEFQRPLVRATNTGATAAIDHRGAVIARLAPATGGRLDTTVEGRTGATPYARWVAALGLTPMMLLAGLVIVAPLWRRRGVFRRHPG